jgi:hypothetical protein
VDTSQVEEEVTKWLTAKGKLDKCSFISRSDFSRVRSYRKNSKSSQVQVDLSELEDLAPRRRWGATIEWLSRISCSSKEVSSFHIYNQRMKLTSRCSDCDTVRANQEGDTSICLCQFSVSPVQEDDREERDRRFLFFLSKQSSAQEMWERIDENEDDTDYLSFKEAYWDFKSRKGSEFLFFVMGSLINKETELEGDQEELTSINSFMVRKRPRRPDDWFTCGVCGCAFPKEEYDLSKSSACMICELHFQGGRKENP